MIEHMRGRSTETKYGRIPLWLYETGVGLQAIATYGWLHGRYGHYERVMPSYGTLARELGVSRGSVIAYVKQLVAVGAVQIETSGAAGQKTNEYVIAFNEPFSTASDALVCGGQNADHLVSGLYRSGQRADQGGQRAVHEEDVLKKTKKTVPPSGSLPAADGGLPRGGGTDGEVVVEAEAALPAPALAMPPGGLAVLLEVFRQQPKLRFTGDALLHQALAIEGRLSLGWRPEDLVLLLAVEPMVGMRTAAGTVAKRIERLPAAPPVGAAAPGGLLGALVPRQTDPAAASASPVHVVLAASPPPSCATCSGYPAPGEEQCPACLGWPSCDGGCGRLVEDGGVCPACAVEALERALAAPETADGTCPGADGPCGRPAVTLGWCARCRVAAEMGAVR